MKKITFIITVFLVVALVGCEKNWLDINKDPNVPTVAQPSKLLTGVQVNFGYTFGQSSYVGNDLLTYVHQLSSREVDQYSMSATGSVGNTWSNHYAYVVPNLDALIQSTEPNGNLQYAGIAKLMKAYSYAGMVDLFGDIPYSEANVLGNIAPKADAAAEIYNNLFILIDEAIANLSNTTAPNLLKPVADDIIYGGNVGKWIRMGNTLKLKLLVNSRLAQGSITGYTQKLNELITANNFMLPDEDFEFWFSSAVTPDQRHPAFVDEYGGGQITYYISPWFYEIMKGLTINATNNPFATIADPRVPYYWVNQLTGTAAAQNPTEYRHGAFISIVFGSIGPNADYAQRESATMIGFYPCGGKYDNGTAAGDNGLKIANGDGVAPQKFITYASSRFMLAELAITGTIGGNAATYYEEGVRAALAHVNKVVGKTTQTGVPQIAATAINTFVTSLMTRYDAATDERKLEMIMTQKWIHNFFNPVDSYTDYRRTGYPILFDPKPGVVIIPINTDGQTNTESAVQLVRKYPKSMWYPQREVELNPNISQKPDLTAAKIFWDTRTYEY